MNPVSCCHAFKVGNLTGFIKQCNCQDCAVYSGRQLSTGQLFFKNDKIDFMDVIQTAALILTIISLLPLAICLIKMRQLKKYKAKATVTNALVTAFAEKRGFKNSTYYLLNIQYVIHTGIQYSGQTISYKKYAPGESIPLMYLTHDPGNIKTDFGQSLKWLLPISILLIGLLGWFSYWLLNLDYYYSPAPN